MPQNSQATLNTARPLRRLGFRDLLDPVTPEDFLDRTFGNEALYLPGSETRFDDVFSWQDVADLLNMTTLWSAATLKVVLDGRNVGPEEYCISQQNRDGAPVAQPDPARVQALIRQGATISLNLVETMTPAVAAIAAGLQCWFDGETVCNIYCSWGGHQGFQSHFDIHDVFVLQIDGTKTWNIYDGQFEESVNLDGYRSNNFSEAHHAAARGQIQMQPTMTPGDVLYIPRGRYHDALASSDASLHLTFGVEFMSGFHFLGAIGEGLLQNPYFRQPLPRFDQPEAHRAHMRKLAENIHTYILQPELSRAIRAHQRRRAFAYCFPAYNLPSAASSPILRVRSLRTRLVRRGQAWRLERPGAPCDLSGDEARLAEWLLPQDYFGQDEAEAALGSAIPVAAILTRFQAIGLIDAI